MSGSIRCEETIPSDHQAIEHLLDLAFGSDRRNKTSYRLREGNTAVAGLSLVARDPGVGPAGTISFWPLAIGEGKAPALLLGPLAVHPDRQGLGIGIRLMREGIARAQAQGHALVLLVGDEPYYSKVGFRRLPEGRISLPGPVDPARFLFLELVPGALEGVSGEARVPASAPLAIPHAAQGEEQRCEA